MNLGFNQDSSTIHADPDVTLIEDWIFDPWSKIEIWWEAVGRPPLFIYS